MTKASPAVWKNCSVPRKLGGPNMAAENPSLSSLQRACGSTVSTCYGKDLSEHGLDEYSQFKHVMVKPTGIP
jgi:hypothetical protein